MINYKVKSRRKATGNKFNYENLGRWCQRCFLTRRYKRYLEFCGKFHHYSFNNIMLILMQYPNAQMCKLHPWKKLKMQVRKGEEEALKSCVRFHTVIRKENTNESEEEKVISAVGFKIGHVFDIARLTVRFRRLMNSQLILII